MLFRFPLAAGFPAHHASVAGHLQVTSDSWASWAVGPLPARRSTIRIAACRKRDQYRKQSAAFLRASVDHFWVRSCLRWFVVVFVALCRVVGLAPEAIIHEIKARLAHILALETCIAWRALCVPQAFMFHQKYLVALT
jgi:hypothetical protein